MCQSKSEGGQRCAAHTRPRYEAATFGTAEWDEAAAEYAASGMGRGMLMLEIQHPDGVSVERQVALETAIRRGDELRGVAAQTRREVAAGRTAGPTGIPSIKHMHPVTIGGTITLQDGSGRAFSADGKKVFEFLTEEDAFEWMSIAAKPAAFNRWIPAGTKPTEEPFPWERR